MQSELKIQDEIQLFHRFHAGDETAGREIIEINSRIVSDYVARIRRNGAFGTIREDLLQSGYEGLLVARNRFKPNLSTEFSTYAYYWVRKYVLDEIDRETNFYSTHEFMDGVNSVCEDDETPFSVEEKFGCDDGIIDYEILLCDLEKILSPFEFYICNLIGEGNTMEAIGKSRNVSRQRIHQLVRRVRSKIRQELMSA